MRTALFSHADDQALRDGRASSIVLLFLFRTSLNLGAFVWVGDYTYLHVYSVHCEFQQRVLLRPPPPIVTAVT